MTPQLTEQYGQVLRVSEAREILRPAVCAYTGVRSNPKAESPAPPTRLLLRKVRRENSMSRPPSVKMNQAATSLQMPAKNRRFCEPSVYFAQPHDWKTVDGREYKLPPPNSQLRDDICRRSRCAGHSDAWI